MVGIGHIGAQLQSSLPRQICWLDHPTKAETENLYHEGSTEYQNIEKSPGDKSTKTVLYLRVTQSQFHPSKALICGMARNSSQINRPL